MKLNLTINLVYIDDALGSEWKKLFGNRSNINILKGDITEIKCDAIVSPANSFGFMDGGLDYYLSLRFGWDVQKRLQSYISNLPMKEILVGEAYILETYDNKIPWLISAPTMRVPMSYNISTSLNAYLAMKAILIHTIKHPSIKTISVPGLCTGCGKMPYHIAALQMYRAYLEIIEGKQTERDSFGDIQKEQLLLNPNSMIWE